MTAGLTFDAGAHVYRHDGVRVPSVTQILAAEGFIDYSFLGEDSAHYLSRGQAVHAACEYLDEDRLDWSTVAPAIEGYVRGYQKFKRVLGFYPTHIETHVFDEIYRYAGTLDRVGRIGDARKILIDLKTGPICSWVGAQLGGYAGAVRFNQIFADWNYLERWGVQLTADGGYQITKFEDHEGDLAVFRSACICYNWKKNAGILKGE